MKLNLLQRILKLIANPIKNEFLTVNKGCLACVCYWFADKFMSANAQNEMLRHFIEILLNT